MLAIMYQLDKFVNNKVVAFCKVFLFHKLIYKKSEIYSLLSTRKVIQKRNAETYMVLQKKENDQSDILFFQNKSVSC